MHCLFSYYKNYKLASYTGDCAACLNLWGGGVCNLVVLDYVPLLQSLNWIMLLDTYYNSYFKDSLFLCICDT